MSAIDIAVNVARETWLVLGEMAPYLLFGFLAAGVLSVCISPEFVERHLGGRGFGPVLKAAIFGVPLPLCSCGVIPVGASFRRHGASRAATTSFLLSTPQTGIDSIAITYALLGPVIAIFRPIVAFVTGLLGGALVWLLGEAEDGPRGNGPQHCSEACCADRGKRNVLQRILKYGFVILPRDIGAALLAGVAIAGVIGAVVPKNGWEPYLGSGILSIVAMMLLGVPMYVCASASVPIAAGLIHAGASPGAALAFLISGPASNPATITTVWKLLGRRTALLYLLAVALSAIGGGMLLDWLMPTMHAVVPPLTAHVHPTMESDWVGPLSAVLLLAVIAYSHLMRRPHESYPGATALGELDAEAPASDHLELAVSGMTCEHCVAAVTRALRECHGVTSVQVDLSTGRAVVAGDRVNAEELIAAVQPLGYRAETVRHGLS